MAKKKKTTVKKGMATFTLHMPKQLHSRIKARRNKTGEKMREFMINAVEKALKRAA